MLINFLEKFKKLSRETKLPFSQSRNVTTEDGDHTIRKSQ